MSEKVYALSRWIVALACFGIVVFFIFSTTKGAIAMFTGTKDYIESKEVIQIQDMFEPNLPNKCYVTNNDNMIYIKINDSFTPYISGNGYYIKYDRDKNKFYEIVDAENDVYQDYELELFRE